MRALIIAAYVGPLPELMGLWLRSAGRNPEFDFLVVSDQAAPADLPANVRFARQDLADMRQRFDAVTGLQTALSVPYKLCDFKPLYWALADDLAAYDYWGFCDLDVVWGRLADLLPSDWGRYDALLAEGHLRLFSNSAAMRDLYRHPENPIDWRAALSELRIFGLDEHNGINRALARDHTVSWYSDPTLIADIDPDFRQFRRLSELPNWRLQAFHWQDGRIFHEWVDKGRHCQQELLYIHLQKRKLEITPGCQSAPAFNIDPGGIVPRERGDGEAARIALRNPWYFPNISEARILLREWRRRLLGRAGHFGPIDRPSGEGHQA